MQCYSEMLPPTAVTFALQLSFTGPKSNNLIVAKHTLLQIYAIRTVAPTFEDGHGNGEHALEHKVLQHRTQLAQDDNGVEACFGKSDKSNKTKLILVAEYPLAGTVAGLARIKMKKSRSGGDVLLVAVRDAKMSLVEWDPVACSMATISVHYYEKEEFEAAPWAAPLNMYQSLLVADPEGRCAALMFGLRNLAILPFNTADDDDVEMAGWDAEHDRGVPAESGPTATARQKLLHDMSELPYSPSFVLRLPNLDPYLTHPIDMSFLHVYREPTFGILSATVAPSRQLGRRDCCAYTVLTLDLNQKASTIISSVENLPADLFQVVPLPAPIGGALLVGPNELVYVDQSGKTCGVAVNAFAKDGTAMSLHDQSSLALKLEWSCVEMLSPENAELLMVMNDGGLVIIKFQFDGISVAGFELHPVARQNGGTLISSGAKVLARTGRNTMFVGSCLGDSVVLGWSRGQAQASKKKVVMDQDLATDEDESLGEDDYDDDLYGEAPSRTQLSGQASSSKPGDVVFRIHDRMVSIAPIRDVNISKPTFRNKEKAHLARGVTSDLELVCAVGRGRGSAMASIRRSINPEVVGCFDFPEARRVWALNVRKSSSKALQGDRNGPGNAEQDHDDNLLLVSKVDEGGSKSSSVYGLTPNGFESLLDTEFEPAAGFTVEAGVMGGHNRIVQVLSSEIRSYDQDMALAQIIPLQDEESESGGHPAVAASIQDPHILVLRADHSIYVASIDKYNDFEELVRPAAIASTKWISGCLYKDHLGIFVPNTSADRDVVLVLLSNTGELSMYTLPEYEHIWTRNDVFFLPPTLGSGEFVPRRGQAGQSRANIVEMLVADLGDSIDTLPYLILRSSIDDITIYRPWPMTPRDGKAETMFTKIPNTVTAQAAACPSPSTGDITQQDPAAMNSRTSMRRCVNVGGYATVFLPGPSPSFILKSAKSYPKVIPLQSSDVHGMSSFSTAGCEGGFITLDKEGVARVCQLPARTSLAEFGVAVKKQSLACAQGSEISNIVYHPPSATYFVVSNTWVEFELPKGEEARREWSREKSIPLHSTAEMSRVHLVSAATFEELDTLHLERWEIVSCIICTNLELSPVTHLRKEVICIGTSTLRGEDLPVKSRILIYDVIKVVPHPGRPESHKALKRIACQEVARGPITAMCGIAAYGLLVIAQGPKIMIRGLKEDGALMPVAFVDMSCHVTAIKELPGTNMLVISDAFKGVWFAGYTEAPFRVHVFGRSSTKFEVTTADMLPHGRNLFIVASNWTHGIVVLQFDPEHPKTLQGHLLLHLTTFGVGPHTPTHMIRLPAAPVATASLSAAAADGIDSGNNAGLASATAADEPLSSLLLMIAGATGQLSMLSPLTETMYLRLSSLATQLFNSDNSPSTTNTSGQAPSQPPTLAASTQPQPHSHNAHANAHHAHHNHNHNLAPPPLSLNVRAYRMPATAAAGGLGQYPPPGIGVGVGRAVVDGALLLARWNEVGSDKRAEMAGRAGFASVSEVRDVMGAVLGWGSMAYF